MSRLALDVLINIFAQNIQIFGQKVEEEDDEDPRWVGRSQSSTAKIIISSLPGCQLQTTFFPLPCTASRKSPKFNENQNLTCKLLQPSP